MENGCGFSRRGWLAWMCKDDLLGANRDFDLIPWHCFVCIVFAYA
jgi:hypothetical protein